VKRAEERFREYARWTRLSGKETAVARELLGSKTVKDVAVSLEMPVGTAKTYALRAYRKAGVTSRRGFCAEVFRRIAGEM